MNIQAADAAGDATELAEISAEKIPIVRKTHKYTRAVQFACLAVLLSISPCFCDIPPAHARPNV